MAYSHQRREEIARSKGFGSYREYRAASVEQRAQSTAQLAQRDRTYRGSAKAVRTAEGRRQVFDTPAGRLVRSKRNDVIRSQVAKAAERGERVQVRMTINTPEGPRTVEIFKRGGWDADALEREIAAAGGAGLAVLLAAVAGVYGDDMTDDPADVIDVQLHITE